MGIICKNCGWTRPISVAECRQLRDQNQFRCPKCGNTDLKLEADVKDETIKYSFSSESEIRYIMLAGLFNQGVTVWDCEGEAGACPDPVWVADTKLVPRFGDIPFKYNGRFYIIELKFVRFVGCSLKQEDRLFRPKRIRPLVTFQQSIQIMKGASVMVVVAEPTFRGLGIPAVSSENQSTCEDLLNSEYKARLAMGEIPYNIWILNQDLFRRYWDGGFNFSERDWRRPLSLLLLKNLVPEAKSMMSFSEIRDGAIVDLILEKL